MQLLHITNFETVEASKHQQHNISTECKRRNEIVLHVSLSSFASSPLSLSLLGGCTTVVGTVTIIRRIILIVPKIELPMSLHPYTNEAHPHIPTHTTTHV